MNTFSTISTKIIKTCSTTILTAGLCFGISTTAYSQEFTEFDSQYTSYYGTLSSKQTTYYKYLVPAYTFGVFTLENDSGKSDFDIKAYEYDNGWQLLDKQDSSGTQTELLIVQPSDRDRYIYSTTHLG